MKKAIFLFDYTGIMAKPWADAGYLCYCFDGQHPKGVSLSKHKNILNVGMWFSKDTHNLDIHQILNITGNNISLVFGFPECTDLAVSGAAHFAKKRSVNTEFQEEAMRLVYLTAHLGEFLGCPWALENPISVISSKWRKPDFKFNPFEYGGYLPEDDVHPSYPEYIKPRDAYPKKTCIWSGNRFKKAAHKAVGPDGVELTSEGLCNRTNYKIWDKAEYHVSTNQGAGISLLEIYSRLAYPEYTLEGAPVWGYSDQHKKLGGKSLKTKNIRSATPRGFAEAVFQANGR